VTCGSTVRRVPVEFLSDVQVAGYGAFVGDPSRAELDRFFLPDDRDAELIAKRRGDPSRLGFAVQLGTVRFVGRFLEDPLDVPWPVVEYLAEHLGIEDPSCVKRYTERLKTGYEHAWEIRDAYGYRVFEDPEAAAGLRGFLDGRAWTHVEGPVKLFEQAVAWLRRGQVLLPGISVLTRLVSEVREAAAARVHTTLTQAAEAVDPSLPDRLRALLRVPEGSRFSELERLRRAPRRSSGPEMVRAWDRVSEAAGLGAGAVDVSGVPANRVAALARHGLGSKAPALAQLGEPRRTATLLAVARQLETSAVDDALDLFAALMTTRLINPARRASQADRLAALPRLERASRTLARLQQAVWEVLATADPDPTAEPGADPDDDSDGNSAGNSAGNSDGNSDGAERGGASGDEAAVAVAALWAAVERVASRAEVTAAVAVVDELVGDDDGGADAAARSALVDRYRTVRPFVDRLGTAPALTAAPGGRRVLAAVRTLPGLAARRVRVKPLTVAEIDPEVVPAVWRRAVFGATAAMGRSDRRGAAEADEGDAEVRRDAYVVCVLEQLHRALRVRDVFAVPALRWGDPRARLLDGPSWDAVRDDVLAGLGLAQPVETHLQARAAALDAAWRQMSARLDAAEAASEGDDASGDRARVRIVPAGEGRMRLAVDRLEALGEPASLVELRARTAAMLPRIDLPDLLMEVHAWTGFLDAYRHLSGARTQISDQALSVAALLVAEGCNVGLTPVIKPGHEALTRHRLSHVDQNYLRAEGHAAANARLVAAQAAIPLVQTWGGGLVASVDGLRFVVPVRTLNAGPSPKYFGFRKGLTWLNAVNDQVSGIGATIVAGTPSDSLHILDTILNLDAGPVPEMIATDEGSYSDMVFGVFALLGYRFSPRLSDLSDQRFWRADWPGTEPADYGACNAIARHKVNLTKVRGQWPDMLRVAGSLLTGTVRAYDLLRMLSRDGRPSPLGQGFTEYGRIAKTQHLLGMVDPLDDTQRRTVNTQTTVQESRHRLARKIFYGRQGQIYQAYREGQEDQLGALGIVLNAVTLWNSRYCDAAVQRQRAQGYPVLDADAARLSPLGHAHLNVLGRYSFTTRPPGGGLRPLRDPAADPDS